MNLGDAARAWVTWIGVAAFAAAQGGVADQGAVEAQGRAPNRLSGSSSPYLRQHQFNPVDWHPWGSEALALAKRLDKPIFLSIGYSACHWCHVMAEESFSDPAVARLLNDSFVCIKVDREERPDLDQIYMGALQAMGRQGGWPLSAWLTPGGRPFFGGTYFPPEDARGLPGFRRVCEALSKAWVEERAQVLEGARELSEHLASTLAPAMAPGEPSAEMLAGLTASAAAWFDGEEGGFASPPRFAPKFPQAPRLRMLLEHDEAARAMAVATLEAMRRGGIHDQIGGGFHRYSTDREWRIPHFEKMLYDNAQLASVYLRARAWSGDDRFAAVARSTLDYLVRELQAPSGGFWSSQDAQSEGVEGKFFVWTRAEFEALLGYCHHIVFTTPATMTALPKTIRCVKDCLASFSENRTGFCVSTIRQVSDFACGDIHRTNLGDPAFVSVISHYQPSTVGRPTIFYISIRVRKIHLRRNQGLVSPDSKSKTTNSVRFFR